MALFAVILANPNAAIEAALPRQYPEHQRFGDRAYMIRAKGSAQEISAQLLTANGVTNGAVIFRVTADYYGYSQAAFWDWIRESFTGADNE